MKILVTGGTGVIGRELVGRLRDRGAQVQVLTRRAESGPGHVQGDLMIRTYLSVAGKRRLLLRIPIPGRAAADFRAGGHLLTEGGQRGERTFTEFLRSRIGPDGTIGMPYGDLGRRLRGG